MIDIKKRCKRLFRVDRSDMTLTVPAPYAQQQATTGRKQSNHRIPSREIAKHATIHKYAAPSQSKCRTRRHPIHRVNHQMAKASSTAKLWGIEANHQVEWSSKITKEMKALLLTDSKSTRATRYATLKLHLRWPTWSVNKMATTVNSPTSWKAANTCNRWCQLYLSIGPHKTSAFTNQLTQAAPEYPTTSAANVLTKNSSRWIY